MNKRKQAQTKFQSYKKRIASQPEPKWTGLESSQFALSVTELRDLIFQYLDLDSLKNMARTCKACQATAQPLICKKSWTYYEYMAYRKHPLSPCFVPEAVYFRASEPCMEYFKLMPHRARQLTKMLCLGSQVPKFFVPEIRAPVDLLNMSKKDFKKGLRQKTLTIN